jgi:hypothetical protein
VELKEVLWRIPINLQLQTSPYGTVILNFELSTERFTASGSVFKSGVGIGK